MAAEVASGEMCFSFRALAVVSLAAVTVGSCTASTRRTEDGEPDGSAPDASIHDGDGDIAADGGDADPDGADAGACVPGCNGGPCEPGQWATVCAGTFTMGSAVDELGRGDEYDETAHEVTLTRDFLLLSTEVTLGEFVALLGYDTRRSSRCDEPDCAMSDVNWYEAAAYCNALSDAEGLDRCYDCSGTGETVFCEPAADYATPYECPGYRLPTEAEWEYAARAGTTTATYNGDLTAIGCCDDVLGPIAWYACNGESRVHPVATRAPSSWGLFDMLGNVEEWCADEYLPYPTGPVTDPYVWISEPRMGSVLRGGGFGAYCRRARAASRFATWRIIMLLESGFRPARSLP